MATRQYIGARYVPTIFADENGDSQWRDNIPYEALTIVTNLGNSYTSRKPVPVGIQIDNGEYWALTGNYNAQVEAYRQEVERVKDTIDSISNKNVIVIGDSYGVTDSRWNPNDPYPVIAKRFLGMDNNHFRYSCQAGAGFANGWFLNNLNSLDSDENTTDVYVFGGWNDAIGRTDTGVPSGVTVNDVITGMLNFYTRAKEKYPNAKVHIGFISWRFGGTEIFSGLFEVRDIYLGAEEYGYNVCKNMQYVLHNKSLMGFAPNYDHPNYNGSIALAKALCDLILSGTNDVHYGLKFNNTDVTVASGYTLANPFEFKQELNNGTIINQLFVSDLPIIVTKADLSKITFDANGASVIKLFDIPNCLANGGNSVQRIPVTIFVENNGNVNDWFAIPSDIIVEDCSLYIRPHYTAKSSIAGESITTDNILIGSGIAPYPSAEY